MKRDCIEDIEELINDPLENIRADAYDGLLLFGEETDGTNCLLESHKILPHLVDKLIEEKAEKILNRTVQLLRLLMQRESGTPKALETEIISRLMNLISQKY